MEILNEGRITEIEVRTGGRLLSKGGFITFSNKSGKCVGNISRAEWFLRHNLMVCEDHQNIIARAFEDGKLIGYVGFSHRGAGIFKIGDRLFEEDYEPVIKDFPAEDFLRRLWTQTRN